MISVSFSLVKTWNAIFNTFRAIHVFGAMAKSKYEYVKKFEADDICIPNCWVLVNVKKCSSFQNACAAVNAIETPNDKRGLELANKCASSILNEIGDICLAYGYGDEYNFVFQKDSTFYNRRSDKLLSVITSMFASNYVYYWETFFTSCLKFPPIFAGEVYTFPSASNLKDFLSWKQAQIIEDKIRYGNEPAVCRLGTTLVKEITGFTKDKKVESAILPFHAEMNAEFWQNHCRCIFNSKSVRKIFNSDIPKK